MLEKNKARSKEYLDSRKKRLLDLVISLLVLLPTLSVVAIIGLLSKVEDGGQIFFKQQRIGKDGKKFDLYKLRTMNDEGEITKIGKFIRPFAIDEFTQIFNIIKGDMSLFGIRALSQFDFDRLSDIYRANDMAEDAFLEKWQQLYRSAKPGGLSLAVANGSVKNRTYTTFEAVKEKMESDIEQVENASFVFEMGILLSILSKLLTE